MPRWIGLLLFAWGCPGSVPVPDDTDTDTDETDESPVETDIFETGWGEHTGPDTDTDVPVDTDTDTDTDTGDSADTDTALVTDTALCPYGEIPDCSGICFPSYFLGDGTCDDGVATMSDFSCVAYRLDEGDCGEIGPGPESCDYVMRIITRGFENEIGWKLLDPQGVVLFRVNPGTYTDGFRTYEHPISLSDATFTMVMIDSWGDGWNAGRWELVRPTSGEVVASGTLEDDPAEPDLVADPQEEPVTFAASCVSATAPECDLELLLASGTAGAEMAYEIKAPSGFVLYDTVAGVIGDNEELRDTIRLATGTYTFRMTDAGRNGWQGGHVRLTYPGGYVAGVGTLTGFQVGSFQLGVDCDRANEPPIASPTEVFPVDCGEVQVVVNTEADGPEVGFTVYDAESWAQIASRDSNSLFGNVQTVVGAPLPRSGTYAIVPRDSIGDGWQGTRLTIRDRSTMTDLLTTSLPFGFNSLTTFEVECTDQVVDTAPPPPTTCPPGAVEDCNGVCWPAAYRTDNQCDDGVRFAPNFKCLEQCYDNGACDVPRPRGCVPE